MRRLEHLRSVVALLTIVIVAAPAHATTPPPSNDNRSNASAINALPAVSYFEGHSTLEPGEDSSCGGARGTVWYAYRSPVGQTMTATLHPPEYMGGGGESIHVYRKDRSVMTSIACGTTSISWQADAGAHYFIQATASYSVLSVSGSAQPTGKISGAENIVAPPFPFYEFAGIGTTPAAGEPEPTCARTYHQFYFGTTWFAYTADTTRVLNADVYAADPIFVQTYTRGLDGSMQPVSCGATLSGYTSADVYQPVTAGQTIWIQMGFNADPSADSIMSVFDFIFTLSDAASA